MKTKFNKAAVVCSFSPAASLPPLLSEGLTGVFCSGCMQVLNHYSWRAKACRTEGVFNRTEGLGFQSPEILLKNKSVYKKRFESELSVKMLLFSA